MKLPALRLLILLQCFCLFTNRATGQKNDFSFVHYNITNGLSSNNIKAIVKDSYGYLWIATDDGLSKFDGSRFVVYNHIDEDSSSLPTGSIVSLYEDKDGNFWIGTALGLYCYDRLKDCFKNYTSITGKVVIRSFCSDKQNALWIGTFDGLIRYDHATGQSEKYVADTLANGLESNFITAVFEDSKQRLWVGTNVGLYMLQRPGKKFLKYTNVNGERSEGTSIKAIVEDSVGRIWVATAGNGLSVLERDAKSFQYFKHDLTDGTSLSTNLLSTMVCNDGYLWIGTEEGLNRLNLHTLTISRFAENERSKFNLKDKNVKCIYIDNQNICWIGTFNGLYKYDRNQTIFNLVESNPFDPKGLNFPMVTSFAEAPNGNIYVGTDGRGLNLFDRSTGLCQHITIDPALANNKLSVLSLERSDNLLWIGTYQYGLYVLNITTGEIHHYSKGLQPNQLSSNDIFCLKKDREGNIWIGSNGAGIDVYVKKTGQFKKFSSFARSANGISISRYIRFIEEDATGKIWIGTIGTGLVIYEPAIGTYKVYFRSNTSAPLDDVQTIFIQDDSTAWLGTPGKGLFKMSNKNGQQPQFKAYQNIVNKMICKILQDSSGRLWVSTNQGVSCLPAGDSIFRNFTSYSGLQASGFMLNAGLRTSKNELYFGGQEGFNYFFPGNLNFNLNVPKVVFTDLKVANQSVRPGATNILPVHISLAKQIELSYNQSFSIDFSALDFTDPLELQYMYRLEGIDTSWNVMGQSKTIWFTHLSPGKYILKVRAQSPNGRWTTEDATLAIIIKPPFWQTYYAYAFYLLCLGAILWLLRRKAIRRMHEEFAQQQEKERVRQFIENERKDAERQKEFHVQKIKFLTNLSHELRTPVALIVGQVDTLKEKMEAVNETGRLQIIRRNAARLLQLVNRLLDVRNQETKELKLNLSESDLVALAREIADSFRDLAQIKKIQFVFTCMFDQFQTTFDKDKMERILFNVLGNAFKFTPEGGQITFSIGWDTTLNRLALQVTDTGVGMSPEEQSRVFDRHFQGEQGTQFGEDGSGLGLSIVKDFVQLHDGSITLKSNTGEGSTFSIYLPFNANETAPVLMPEQDHIKTPVHDANLELQQEPETENSEKLKVLIVEDHEDYRAFLKESLMDEYKIYEAANGVDGWKKALASHPDIIVSDLQMPLMDGIEFAQKIKSDKRTSHIPVIFLTAQSGDDTQLQSLKTGASDYLTKPFQADILKLKIKNLALLNKTSKEIYSQRVSVQASAVEVESEKEKMLLEIAQYIEAHIGESDLSVEDLSKHMCMSRSTLYNKIVEMTGETPIEYIRSFKLGKAAELLEKTDLKIAEIGYRVGFGSPNYFSRAFKAKYDILPSDYAVMKRKK
ncbi:hybrid sensor histidine kinase/response regulator transcription factor [Pinibacter aurantiacus]|uniref:histidine kinase n=1 Tax=Pinibacter aurantiacus TaxID=2851599 RepID=A0A9E2W3N8_9BACT|nr:hybrid sensor histidine kinase/response regulator transcription factor [Pinibacter aurantiacus]MBV4358755.1 response regulator [Pinibacter aurantiacus]